MLLFLLLSAAPLAYALVRRARPLPLPDPLPLTESERRSRVVQGVNGPVELPPLDTIYYFDQLIDHNDASKGTFQQRYWMNWEWYALGGPVVLATPGESDASNFAGYVTNRSIIGTIAQQEHGASVLFEHRFFGASNPYPDLSVESLRMLTLQQSIDDVEYFVKNVQLPMPGSQAVASNVPWVFVGGSYSGALTAWTMVNKPGLFQAGYATSAVVQTIADFWQYFEPIREYMPQNCSADVQAVVARFDDLAQNATAFDALKAEFGMADVQHADDVTSALRGPLSAWQALKPTTRPGAPFFQFCDALEVKDGQNAGAEGWGLDYAVSAWGAWFKDVYLPESCGPIPYSKCLGSYDATDAYYTDISVGNAERAWFWLVCNEVGWFQDTAPDGHPTLVSRLLHPSNQELRQCQLMFPEAFPSAPPLAPIRTTNTRYSGWDLDVQNIFFANGQRDPWRDATVSADGIAPAHISATHIGVHDGVHVVDLVTANNIDPTVRAVQEQGLALVKGWLAGATPGGRGVRGVVGRR
ncbi:peptidase S28 [Vararia minispora EC-137]|uniref:Peptidase S28 n=1 Tax=Vararia minispora EC-137 TaxID=1314806 RepID=A0ACB8QEC7_9AGAM|nr:peptidase S28 [Vararia minispora EC-137]